MQRGHHTGFPVNGSGSEADHDRRGFLFVAIALASGGLLGCDPPTPRGGRTLPSAAEGLPELPKGTATPNPQQVARSLQRPSPPTSEPMVRVRVATIRPPQQVARVEGDGRHVQIGAVNGGPMKNVTLPATIEATLDGWLVIESVGSKNAGTFRFGSGPLEIKPAAGSRGVRLAKDIAGNTSWPWGLRLVNRTDEAPGAIDVVCHVAMEQYLPGVLAKELYNSWSLDTHLAQAIAARSFALCEIAQADNRHFDVVAGEASQAWTGPTTHATSLEAVRRTAGMVMVWESRVVPAYYSSTCGGRPANATDAISPIEFNAIAPLSVGADSARDCCKGAPAWRWKLSLPTNETAKRVAGWARTDRPAMARIDGIRAIEVSQTNAAGRPLTFRVSDSKGQVFDVPAERMRWALNADVFGLPDVRTRVKSADFSAQVTAISINLEGRGYGHGVGLCQYGAEALSKRGQTWQEILSRYYPGATVQQTYGASVRAT